MADYTVQDSYNILGIDPASTQDNYIWAGDYKLVDSLNILGGGTGNSTDFNSWLTNQVATITGAVSATNIDLVQPATVALTTTGAQLEKSVGSVSQAGLNTVTGAFNAIDNTAKTVGNAASSAGSWAVLAGGLLMLALLMNN